MIVISFKWESRYHVIKGKKKESSPSMAQRLRSASRCEQTAALFLSLNERHVDGEGLQHRFGCLKPTKDSLLLKHLAGKSAPLPKMKL